MQEYPKALYFGTVQAHQHKVVNSFEHEAELRELGFVDFADLEKETEALMGESTSGSASSEDFKNAFVPVEQFDAVSEDLVKKETQLGAAQNERDFYIQENIELKEQLNKERDWIKHLQSKLDSLQPNPAPQDTVVELVTQGTPIEPVAPDYSNASAKELREALDAKGIKYLQRDNVDTLRALLTQPAEGTTENVK